MATDYEIYYRENKHGLGEPANEIVAFFNSYDHTRARVLDVGCGQGRDALFIARLGHDVCAIDISPTGISDIKSDAAKEGLSISTQVIDIRDYKSRSKFDIILMDRTLHMLEPKYRIITFRKYLNLTQSGSYVLIADEKSNISNFKNELHQSNEDWTITLEKQGFLFARRQ